MRPLLRRPRFEEKRRRKKRSNFNSLTLPPKELEAQEMRPLLRRPRFEEKNKKENKIQHHFHDCAAKKNQTQAMCLLFRRRRFERNCRKSKWQPHPTFFSGWWLSHDWICWVLRCLLSQVILLEKIRETLGPQTKTNTECMQSTPLKKKWVFCRTAC